MSRRKIIVGLLVAAALIVPAAWRRAPSDAQTAVLRGESPNRRELIGTTSCAASACHGRGALGEPLSEALTWRSLDPHARAYDSLLTPRSQAMARQLWDEKTKAHDAPLCLKCHVHPDYDHARPNFRKQDGVGCESCHGAAQDWLKPHYRAGWNQANKVSLGFADTKSLSGRAEICAKCHVGTPEASVDHDLMAAGHPALRFEFATYFANLPPHWDVARDKKANSTDPAKCIDFEMRAWVIGQFISSAVAWDLLAHRVDPANKKPWPEFAEMDCFSCHHDLQDARWRRQTGLGRLVKNDWYDTASGEGKKIGNLFANAKRAEMAVGAKARASAARSGLGTYFARSKDLCADPPLFDAFRKAMPDPSWNRATQHYLFLLSQRQMRKDNRLPESAELEKRIVALRQEVTFPPDFDSPLEPRTK